MCYSPHTESAISSLLKVKSAIGSPLYLPVQRIGLVGKAQALSQKYLNLDHLQEVGACAGSLRSQKVSLPICEMGPKHAKSPAQSLLCSR